jgi:uncharacterized protein (TIGR03435 family)
MRCRLALALVGAAVLSAAMACAQSRPAFDVASLKPSPLHPGDTFDRININLGNARHGVVTLSNACLADCLRFAYGITNNEEIAGPDWIKDKSVRFDIEGKAPPDTPLPRSREMLQTLLVERFRLEYHVTQKSMPYLALAVGKNGSKLTEAVESSGSSHNSFLIGKIDSDRVTMTTLATVISRFLGVTVVDRTGLTGWYAVKLEWSREPPETSHPPESPLTASVEPLGPNIFSAVESQLGLKLEHRKGPLDVMVIDHAERVPIGN